MGGFTCGANAPKGRSIQESGFRMGVGRWLDGFVAGEAGFGEIVAPGGQELLVGGVSGAGRGWG